MLLPSLIAGLVATASPADAPPPTVIGLTERAPLAFVLNTPSGQKGRLRVSEIISALAEPLDRHTDLALAAVDSTAVRECEGALACLARRAPPKAQLMLVVSYFAASGQRPDRVSALLVDIASADACAADPFGAERVDECVSERAVRERPPPENLRDAGAAQAVLGRLVQDKLRRSFEAKGHWEPRGQVLLHDVPGGAALLVDERTVGVAPGGPILLQGVAVGAHQVAYSVGGVVQAGQPVEVTRGAQAELTFTVDVEGFKQPLFWSGVGVAALGVGLSAWSLAYASSQSDKVQGCAQPSCRASFFTLEQQVAGDIEIFEENPNEGSVLALPLGYSLLLTGGTWALGSQLVEDDPVLHWILVGAGVAAGALAYGVSAAANGP